MALTEVAIPFERARWEALLSQGSPSGGGVGMDVSVRGTDVSGQAWVYILGLTGTGAAYRWLGKETGPLCTPGFGPPVEGRWHSRENAAVWDSGDGQFNGFLKYVTRPSGRVILVLHDPDAYGGTLMQALSLPTVHAFIPPTRTSYFQISQHTPYRRPLGLGRLRLGGQRLAGSGTTFIAWDTSDADGGFPPNWSYDVFFFRNSATGEYGDAAQFFEPSAPSVLHRAGFIGSRSQLTGDNLTLALEGDAACADPPVTPTRLRARFFTTPFEFIVTGMLGRSGGTPTVQQPTMVQRGDDDMRGFLESVRYPPEPGPSSALARPGLVAARAGRHTA